MNTARELFHREGYNAIGVNEICQTAGVAKGSFYHFFATKDDLLESVVEANADCLIARLEALQRSEQTGREQLLSQLRGTMASARAQKKRGAVLGCDLGSLANELATYNPVARKTSQRAFRRWLRILQAMTETGIEDGSLDPHTDVAATAAGLLAVIQGISTLARTFNSTNQIQRIVDVAENGLIPATG